MSDYPACFHDKAQYDEWKLLAIKSTFRSRNICIDCTPEYQAKMMLAKRCQSPDANVAILQLREIEHDMRQEIIKEKLETFNDPWANMLHQLVFEPAPIVKKTRNRKDKNEPAV